MRSFGHVPVAALAAALAAALPAAAQDSQPQAEAAPEAQPQADAAPEGQPQGEGLPPLPLSEATGTYAIGPHHSQILFSFDHIGFSTATGMIRDVTGTLTLDAEDPSKSSVEVSFPLSDVRTVAADLDQHMMDEPFFDGVPPDSAITYKSTSVEPTGETTATVTGDLTLNGQTKPVTLDVTLNQFAVSPITNKPTAGFHATGTLKRSDFGLGAYAPAISDEIQLTIDSEAVKN